MTIIYHLTGRTDWEASSPGGEYRAESLALEGFLHCSQDEAQLLAVANRLFAGRTDLLVLDVDTSRLHAAVKHEASRSGEIYPHIYGPLNTDAVVRVRLLTGDAQGDFSAVGEQLN